MSDSWILSSSITPKGEFCPNEERALARVTRVSEHLAAQEGEMERIIQSEVDVHKAQRKFITEVSVIGDHEYDITAENILNFNGVEL